MASLLRWLGYLVVAVVAVVALVATAFLLGILGIPAVDDVTNRFAGVNESTTTVDTDLDVRNPNPIDIVVGGLSIDYDILMNDVPMANGSKHGVSIENGRSTLRFTTAMANARIPEWWYTHVRNGETTEVLVDVAVTHGLLGGRSVSLPQQETVRTDILGQFNDSTTRPVNAGSPLVSDPVLYINETAATYGSPLSVQRTPLEMEFALYNPKPYPYTLTEVGYTIEMNGIPVGEGSTERATVIAPRTRETVGATTVIRNEHLDEWWVSHLERDQVTDLVIDFYLVVDPDARDVLGQAIEPIRLDVAGLDYETQIKTDIFGTKATDGIRNDATRPSSSDESTPSGTPSTETEDGTTTTDTPTESSAGPPEETPTPTETDDGALPL